MDHRMTHHREATRFAGTGPKTQVFVVQRQPQCLDHLGELWRSDTCSRLVEQLGADAQLLQ
ncbi:hypothetical protein D3C84_1074570 [compost metagenome]